MSKKSKKLFRIVWIVLVSLVAISMVISLAYIGF